MSVRMRHTKGHTRNRRSHHALKTPHLCPCSNCGELHLRHRVCNNCGQYRGRQVIDVAAQMVKKQERTKEKLKARGKSPESAEKPEKTTPAA